MDIRCWNCNKLFGKIIQGSINIQPTTSLREIYSNYQEEIKCNGCKKFTTKYL